MYPISPGTSNLVSINSLIKASRAFETDIFEFDSENGLLFNGIEREEKNRYTHIERKHVIQLVHGPARA
jgi:hypothetical protein